MEDSRGRFCDCVHRRRTTRAAVNRTPSRRSASTMPTYGIRKAAMVTKAAVAERNSTIALLAPVETMRCHCHHGRKSNGLGWMVRITVPRSRGSSATSKSHDNMARLSHYVPFEVYSKFSVVLTISSEGAASSSSGGLGLSDGTTSCASVQPSFSPWTRIDWIASRTEA